MTTRKTRVGSSKPTTNGAKMKGTEVAHLKVFRLLAKKKEMMEVKVEAFQESRPVLSYATGLLSMVV